MTRTKTMAVLLLAVAYWTVAYGNSLRVMMPSAGAGAPIVDRASSHAKEIPRPSWAPRRHLPLVKIPSLDHHVASPPSLTYTNDCSGRHRLPRVNLDRDVRCSLASRGRAPPIR